MADVVVVGAAGLDTCVYLAAPTIDLTVEGNFTDNTDGVGQAGGYASRGYAALGYSTAYIGAVADDAAGRVVRSVLAGEGIDVSSCFDDPAGTARSVNLMYADGRRVAFYDGRGNPWLTPDLSGAARLLGPAQLCHVSLPNWCRHVLPLARAAQTIVMTDLQDVRDIDDPYRLDFVTGSDIVCFSTANLGDPEPAMRAYWRRNPDLVQLAGMGAAGCAVGVGGDVVRFPAVDVDLPIVDTNGAGDALAVGFASAYVLDGLDVHAAAQRGQLAARVTCAQRTPKGPLATPAVLAALQPHS